MDELLLWIKNKYGGGRIDHQFRPKECRFKIFAVMFNIYSNNFRNYQTKSKLDREYKGTKRSSFKYKNRVLISC